MDLWGGGGLDDSSTMILEWRIYSYKRLITQFIDRRLYVDVSRLFHNKLCSNNPEGFQNIAYIENFGPHSTFHWPEAILVCYYLSYLFPSSSKETWENRLRTQEDRSVGFGLI